MSPAHTLTSVVPASHVDLLDAKGFGHLATLGPEGEPQSHPIWYDTDGSHVMISTTKARQKYRNVMRDRRVSMSILDPDDPYRYLEVRGVVTSVDDDPDQAFIDRLAKKYLGMDEYPWKQPGDERVVVKIQPVHCTTQG